MPKKAPRMKDDDPKYVVYLSDETPRQFKYYEETVPELRGLFEVEFSQKELMERRAAILARDLSMFEDKTALEVILSFHIPQLKVRRVAQNLLNSIESFGKIFTTSFYKLIAIQGMCEEAAKLINLMGDACIEEFNVQKVPKINAGNYKLLAEHYAKRFTIATTESCYLLFYSEQGLNRGFIEIKGEESSCSFDMQYIIYHAMKAEAKKAVLIHNHVHADAKPSIEDIVTTKNLINKFRAVKIDFVEHIVISGTQYNCIISKEEGTVPPISHLPLSNFFNENSLLLE